MIYGLDITTQIITDSLVEVTHSGNTTRLIKARTEKEGVEDQVWKRTFSDNSKIKQTNRDAINSSNELNDGIDHISVLVLD